MLMLIRALCFMALNKWIFCYTISRNDQESTNHTSGHISNNNSTHLKFLESELLKSSTFFDDSAIIDNFSGRNRKTRLRNQYPNLSNEMALSRRENSRFRKKPKHKRAYKRSFGEFGFNNANSGHQKIQTAPVIDDFFSLLQLVDSTSKTIVNISKENYGTLNSKSSLQCTPSTLLNNTLSLNTTNETPKTPRKIILPGNMTKINLKNNDLYLKAAENSDTDIGDFFNNESEGEHGDVPITEHSTKTDESTTVEETVGSEESPTEEVVHKEQSNHKDKQACESNSGKKCLCSIQSVQNVLSDVFVKTTSQSVAIEKIKGIHCNTYVPIPDRFEINSHAKPKGTDKEKKTVAVNQETGPKEIEKSALSDFISQITSSSVEDEQVEVFPGADVYLPCFPTKTIHLSSNNEDDVTYKWSHTKNKPITEGNIKPNSDGEGSLFIDEATVVNSDNYTCTVEYINPDTGQQRQEEFVHSISIVTLPIVTVRVFMSYTTASCDKSTTENLRKYLPHQVEKTVCEIAQGKHLCGVEVRNAVCLDSIQDHKERSKRSFIDGEFAGQWWHRKKREGSKELSLNYEVYIHKHEEQSLSSANASLCDPNCHLLTIFKLLQLLRDNIEAAVHVPVYSDMDNNAGTFTPMISAMKVKYIFGCHDGNHHIGNGFCGACPKNTYSKNGAVTCTKCPANSYQGNIASSECIFCDTHWIPYCNEFVADYNLYLVIFLAVSVILVLLGVVILYMNRVKNKTMADMVSRFTNKEEKFKRNVKFGKTFRSPRAAKRASARKHLTPELQAMVDTSDLSFTEPDTETEEEPESQKLIEDQTTPKRKRRRRRKKKLLLDSA